MLNEIGFILRYAAQVAARIIGVCVMLPATAVCLVAMCKYDLSFYKAARGGYEYAASLSEAQTAVHPGYLTVMRCRLGAGKGSVEIKGATVCEQVAPVVVSVDTLAYEAGTKLALWYGVLVAASLIAAILVMGPRQFFLMDPVVRGKGAELQHRSR